MQASHHRDFLAQRSWGTGAETHQQLLTLHGKQRQTCYGEGRKDISLTALFKQREKFFTIIDIIRGLLPILEKYAKKYQMEAPVIHTLHGEMFSLVRHFLTYFLKLDIIPETSAKKLLKLDVKNTDHQLPDKRLCVGQFAFVTLRKARTEKRHAHWIGDLYTKLRAGYVAAAETLLRGLPLLNKTTFCLSAMNPEAARDSTTGGNLMLLAGKLPNIFTDEDLGLLDLETWSFAADTKVTELSQKCAVSDARVDTHFWVQVFQLQEAGGGGPPLPATYKAGKGGAVSILLSACGVVL